MVECWKGNTEEEEKKKKKKKNLGFGDGKLKDDNTQANSMGEISRERIRVFRGESRRTDRDYVAGQAESYGQFRE